MGASFLSKPVTDKHSSYEENDKLKCGLSSMQGWRLDQEDAHNCILNYDTDTSFFAVYDGHGGREVAEYCSQKLPDFIKNTPAYKEGDIERALIEGFLEFDKTLWTPEVISELKKLQKTVDGDGEEESDVEENVKHLYEEAAMPIEEVIKKYKKSNEDDKGDINILIPKRKGQSNVDSSTSSSSDAVASSSTQDSCSSAEAGTSKKENKDECKDEKQSPQPNGTATITSPEDSSSKTEKTDNACKITESVQNGEVSEDQSKDSDDCKEQENTATDKGKGKAVLKKSDQPSKNKRSMRTRIVKEVYKALLELDQDEDDSEDEEDKTFEGPNENSSEDDEEESINPHIEEPDSDGSGIEEEEDDEVEEEEEECVMNDEEEDLDDEPGYKSGCTAVVGLLKGNKLYVANIGDSRCLVCRKGKVIEMSEDHKPEKEGELRRIRIAGGHVNSDYRINNGLNLSRAFGDFSYKENVEFSDTQQMVIAEPDIRKLTINPEEDEFMIFACDGIWNSMKNEEVIEFLRPKVVGCDDSEKLSKSVEELIDRCFDPESAYGDTGNDNMTAIVVKFAKKKPSLKRSASASPTTHESKISKTEESPDKTAA